MISASRIGARTAGSATSSATAGAVSDEQFRSAFEAVPKVRVESVRDLFAELQKQASILENVNNDWTKRIKALQMLRALIVTDIGCYSAVAEQSYALLGTAFQLSVKDLRSQLCREACITISYYCEKLGIGFWRVAESVLPITMGLTQNSAKVMATSGRICNIYIIKYIQHPKLLTIIVQQVNSKAKEVRRVTISLVHTMITAWEASLLDKHFPELLHCIKLVLSDADPEARAIGRQTFESLQTLYPTKADALFQELEPSKQRILVGSSTASSTHSVNSERDCLPNPNRGLYNAQNAFLNKRSASDLNHSMRRLNLALPKVVHRPNVVRCGKPPQVLTGSTLRPTHHHPSSVTSTPVSRKIGPSSMVGCAVNKLQKSISTTDAKSSAASQSQPGSRSSSPGRVRHQPPRPHQVAAAAHHAPVAAARKLQNGRDHREIAGSTHSNFARSSPTTDFYGLSQRQEELLQQQISSEEHNTSGGSGGVAFSRKSSANNSFANDIKHHSFSMRDSAGSNFQNGQHKWSFLNSEQLANDVEQQVAFIQEICDIIGTSAAATNEKEIEEALQVLTRMIRDGGITLWNEYFNSIFFAVQKIISRDMERQYNTIKISALKTLKELCLVQPKRLVAKTELLVMIILNAHECEDATVVRAAEDCGAAVANHLPTNTCMNLLLTVIDDKNSKYHQLSGAIKMLSNLLSKLPPEEVESLLPTVVPRMTQCYENAQSMVRRSAIICLVSVSQSIGLDVLKPHLNAATLKLVDVYRERMLKRSDGGTNA